MAESADPMKYIKPTVAILGLLVTGASAWFNLKGDVRLLNAEKADRADVQRIERELERLGNEILSEVRAGNDRTARVERYICRRSPEGLGC